MADERKKALVAELDRQRHRISGDLDLVKKKLHPGHQLIQSVRKRPGRWAVGSAGIAFLAARLFRSKKVIYTDRSKKHGLIRRTGKFAFNLARPALTAFLLKQAQEYAEAKIAQNPDNSMLGDTPQK